MSTPSDDMFAPPINLAMRVLDRSFFQKTIPTSAARVLDKTNISRCRKELERSKDTINHSRLQSVRPDPDENLAKQGGRCIILRPEIVHNDPKTWSSTLTNLERTSIVSLIPYSLHLDYNFWTYPEIITSLIPPQSTVPGSDELPTGFSQAGHIAHLNLRPKYLPFKHLIATILADKNPAITTVINKIDDVGKTNEFRTFKYEVLHGEDDMNVRLREQGCEFRFDFSKVYWNSRLHTEHEYLVSCFKPQEAVCDVMAGIGPFAVPAGKKGVFVHANDLNPDGYYFLVDNILANKVGDYVKASNEDGRDFIKTATMDLLENDYEVEIPRKVSRTAMKEAKRLGQELQIPEPIIHTRPKIFSHYVMNLPASAITFLPSFIGLYAEKPELLPLFRSGTYKYPLLHVYCFSTKSDDNVAEAEDICKRISEMLEFEIRPGDPEVEIRDVRDVAPRKRMFCATFRLPEEVAFRGANSGVGGGDKQG